jgi:hypothetical protein
MEVGIAGQIDRPFLAQFRPLLTEVSHVAWRGAPLEMTGGTTGGVKRAHTLKAKVRRGGSPVTVTPNIPSIYCMCQLSVIVSCRLIHLIHLATHTHNTVVAGSNKW